MSSVILTTELAEQLRAIVQHGPTFPGDTISHKSAESLCEYGLCTRDQDGNFVATEAGIRWVTPVETKTLDSHSREDMNEALARVRGLRHELLCELDSKDFGDEVDCHVSLALDHLSQAQTHFRMAALYSPARQPR